jgi:hypothetical protein
MSLRITALSVCTVVGLAACSTDSAVAPTQAKAVSSRVSHIVGTGLAPHTVAPINYSEPIEIGPDGSAIPASEPKDAGTDAVNRNLITYHGGDVIGKQRVALIYYSPTRVFNNGPTPGTWGNGQADKSLVGFYLNNIAKSEYWNINNGYFDEIGNKDQNYVQDFMQYKSYWAANEGAPTAGQTVSADDMVYLIESGFAKGTLQYDPNTVYMIVTGPGVNLGGGFSSTHLSYCAWHSGYWFEDGSPIVQFGAMPYDADFNPAHPSNNVNPNGTVSHYICTYLTSGINGELGADATVSALTHEIEETATDPVSFKVDPYFGGWYDGFGQENADKCAYTYGAGLVRPPASADYWNLLVAGKSFLVQRNWTNIAPQGCKIGMAGPGTIGATNGGIARQ